MTDSERVKRRVMADGPSPPMRLAKAMLRVLGSGLTTSRFPRWRRKIEHRAYPSPAPVPKSFSRRYRVQTRHVQGQIVYTLAPRHDRKPIHIIYTHGGAYVLPLQPIHWGIIGELIGRVGASVTVPIYPLAPEHTYRAAYPELETVYRNVLRDHADEAIVLCGDSAGGGLALAQAQRYRDLGLRPPDRVILFSPWLDITMSNPDAVAIEHHDALLGIPALVQCGRWWAGGDDPRSPLLSPIFGDLSGLPPIDVYHGTADLLIADARKLNERVSAAGGTMYLYEYPGACHVFVGMPFTPEAKAAYDRVAAGLVVVRNVATLESS